MEITRLSRKDMDSMLIEIILITKFKPIQKEMKHVGRIIINNEVIEEKEYAVPNGLGNKNEFFISISNELQERASSILIDIYSRS